MLESVTVLLIPGALVVAWIVGIEVAPDLIRSFVRLLWDIL